MQPCYFMDFDATYVIFWNLMDFDASKDVIFLILMQVDRSDWRKKFITNTHLEGMDTVLVGGLIPEVTIDMEQKYGDPNQTSNFTGCLSGTLWSIFWGGGRTWFYNGRNSMHWPFKCSVKPNYLKVLLDYRKNFEIFHDLKYWSKDA